MTRPTERHSTRLCARTSGCSATSWAASSSSRKATRLYGLEERIRAPRPARPRRRRTRLPRALAETSRGSRSRRRRSSCGRSRSTSTSRTSPSSITASDDAARSSARAARCASRSTRRSALLAEAGVERRRDPRGRGRVFGRARPHRASDRGAAAHDPREAPADRRLLDELDDPRLTPGERAGRRARRWPRRSRSSGRPTRCAPTRPRVVDEIRQGLWFLEESLWDAAARPGRRLAGAAPRYAAPLRQLDRRRSRRQPERRARRPCARRSSAAASLVRELLRRDVRALAVSWGMSTTLVDADAGGRRRSTCRASRTRASRTGGG